MSELKDIIYKIVFMGMFILTACSVNDVQLSVEEQGRDVINLWVAGEYEVVYHEWFDAELQESLSLSELRTIWEEQIEGNGEKFEIDSLKVSNRSQTIDVVEADVIFTDVFVEVRMIFNENQQLIGFHVSDNILIFTKPDTIVEEEIIVGKGSPFELGGLLTLPKEAQEGLPAVVLVHGSGPSNRDSAIHNNKPFRDLAWSLAQQGIAVIRYDKRTYVHANQIAQNPETFTVFEETIEDAILATQLLRADERIDEDNVFVIGLSLGGMLAPRIDRQGGDFAGIISLAGSPRPLWEIIVDQQMNWLESQGFDEETTVQHKEAFKSERQKILELQEMTAEEAKEISVHGIPGYYWRDLGRYEVNTIVSQIDKPFLILQGEEDFQVFYEIDYSLWKDVLAGHEQATFISYPNLNHLFMYSQGPNRGTVDEYRIQDQVDISVIQDIGRWILEHKN